MNKRFTITRAVLAVTSMAVEQAAIWAVWRFFLPDFGIFLDVSVIVIIMAAWLVFGTVLFIFTTRALRQQATAGLPSMVGSRGKAAGPLAPEGMVKIRGELWGARAETGEIQSGENIIVTGEDGLKLLVRKIT